MKPTFHLIPGGRRRVLAATTFILSAFAWTSARGEVVTGEVRIPAVEAKTLPPAGGYVRTRVTAPALVEPRRPDLAVFLRVTESLPLEPAPPGEVALQGLALAPRVAACAVDGSVSLRNLDVEPVTFRVGDRTLGPVGPGASVTYECTAGAAGEELRPLTVLEWPSVRGGIYVGEIGAAAPVDADGRFRVQVSKGTYELRVLDSSGVIARLPIEVDGRLVDAGVIELGEGGETR